MKNAPEQTAAAPPHPLFENLDQQKWSEEDLEDMLALDDVHVFFVPYECWKCHRMALIFHAAAYEHSMEVTSWMYWPDVLQEIDAARTSFDLPRMGVIKPRFSKTRGEKYVSQGCRHCDAIFGEFPLHEDFITVFGEINPDEHRYQVAVTWPPASLLDSPPTVGTT